MIWVIMCTAVSHACFVRPGSQYCHQVGISPKLLPTEKHKAIVFDFDSTWILKPPVPWACAILQFHIAFVHITDTSFIMNFPY